MPSASGLTHCFVEVGSTVVSTTNSLSNLWTRSEEFQEPVDSNWDSAGKSGMCFGNRTQRTSNLPFSGEIRLSHSPSRKPRETQFSQYSPYVLPMSLWCWCVEYFDSVNLSVFRGNWWGQWDWVGDTLNFSESGWWGRIFLARECRFRIESEIDTSQTNRKNRKWKHWEPLQ